MLPQHEGKMAKINGLFVILLLIHSTVLLATVRCNHQQNQLPSLVT